MNKLETYKLQLAFQMEMMNRNYIPQIWESNGYIPIWEKDGELIAGRNLWEQFQDKGRIGIEEYLR